MKIDPNLLNIEPFSFIQNVTGVEFGIDFIITGTRVGNICKFTSHVTENCYFN